MLRTSGDVSCTRYADADSRGYAPHERRCFLVLEYHAAVNRICSARAEMFLSHIDYVISKRNMLRTSGDVSTNGEFVAKLGEYAPHERRCFYFFSY